MMDFGISFAEDTPKNKIEDLLKERHISKAKLAKDLNVTVDQIDMEISKRQLGKDGLLANKLADYFGVTKSVLYKTSTVINKENRVFKFGKPEKISFHK
ncbi:helix-turn-helix transcriptional regulator [Companilactobacillus nodensis]|nr:helix-turn-helix transcriptional regulator [Companilactobacillus nodensis]